MVDDNLTLKPERKNAHDPRLVKHIARVISGLKKPDWQAIGRDGQKPHLTMAKKVLTARKRFTEKAAISSSDSAEAG